MGHTWVYPIRIPLYLCIGFWNNMGYTKPKKSCSKSKDDNIASIVAPTAGPAASIRPPGPHPPWMRTGWCCGPHGGPRELQSWRAWAPGLGSEIHPPRQARTARPPLPPYQPRSASRLSIMRLIVVFIAVARESPALSIRRSILTTLSRLHLVLVHAVAALLCSVSSSTCQPKPPALLVVRFMFAIVVLVCRFWA